MDQKNKLREFIKKTIVEKLCKRGYNYIASQKRKGEKHNPFLSARAVKVCKGQIRGTAKKDNVEIFRVTSGPRKTRNATELLTKGIKSIQNGLNIKNRKSCTYCEFCNTPDCPR